MGTPHSDADVVPDSEDDQLQHNFGSDPYSYNGFFFNPQASNFIPENQMGLLPEYQISRFKSSLIIGDGSDNQQKGPQRQDVGVQTHLTDDREPVIVGTVLQLELKAAEGMLISIQILGGTANPTFNISMTGPDKTQGSKRK